MVDRISQTITRLPESVFAGISVRYSMQKQAEGTNPPLWMLWREAEEEGLWDRLPVDRDDILLDAPTGIYYDFDKDGDGCFSYAVGMFLRAEAAVPEELFCRTFPESDMAAVMFKYGKDEDIWSVNPHGQTDEYLKAQNKVPLAGENSWCAESYHDDLCGSEEECLCYRIACEIG